MCRNNEKIDLHDLLAPSYSESPTCKDAEITIPCGRMVVSVVLVRACP